MIHELCSTVMFYYLLKFCQTGVTWLRLRHGATAKEELGPDAIGLSEITPMAKSLAEQQGAFIFLMYPGYENDETWWFFQIDILGRFSLQQVGDDASR